MVNRGLRGYHGLSMLEVAGSGDSVADMIIGETVENHENLVSECWIAEGSNLAREARYHGNFQGSGPRAGNDAQVEPGWRSTS